MLYYVIIYNIYVIMCIVWWYSAIGSSSKQLMLCTFLISLVQSEIPPEPEES